MQKNTEERNEYAEIIAKARADEEFKKRLLDDPATVLKENGIEIPQGVVVEVVEGNEGDIHIVLPVKPSNTQELTDEDLENVAAAGIGSGICAPLL